MYVRKFYVPISNVLGAAAMGVARIFSKGWGETAIKFAYVLIFNQDNRMIVLKCL
jgi:hypothetical protein